MLRTHLFCTPNALHVDLSVLHVCLFTYQADHCSAYNKWHETELERWLSDHNVPYPTPADRKDLENLVKNNWDDKVGTPYKDWDTPQLQSYLKSKGADAKHAGESNKDSLVSQVKGYWTDSADSASEAYGSVKDWVFDRSSSIHQY